MLIKKIPTFDFAIILSDSTDILEQEVGIEELCAQDINLKEILEQRIKYEGGKVKKRFIHKYVMRDNVLFECGLCVMALGTDRVIFLREKNTYIPFDLFSGLQKMGIKTFEYDNNISENLNSRLEEIEKYIKNKGSKNNLYSLNNKLDEIAKYIKENEYRNMLDNKLEELDKYIEENKSKISTIVIGASISTADAYLSNFILRFWEYVGKEGEKTGYFKDLSSGIEFNPEISQIRMSIIIPPKISSGLSKDIFQYYEDHDYNRGIVMSKDAFRGIEFRYKVDRDKYLICDYPSTLTASFTTVNDILNLNADEKFDTEAVDRFLEKERDSFLYTLKKLMTEESLRLKLKGFNKTKEEIEEMLIRMKQVTIVEL